MHYNVYVYLQQWIFITYADIVTSIIVISNQWWPNDCFIFHFSIYVKDIDDMHIYFEIKPNNSNIQRKKLL